MNMDRMRVSIVLLAAGQSSRMGGPLKQLMEVAGEPLVRRSARTALLLEPEEVVVVTGACKGAVEKALVDLPLRCAFNADYERGQPTSVAAGVAALSRPCDVVMVMPVDLPLIDAADLQFLCNAYREMESGSIAVPFFEGRRGNPVLFSSAHAVEVAMGRTNVGCRKLIENNPDLVGIVAVPNDHFVMDMDTPQDFGQILERLAASQPFPAITAQPC